MIAIHVNASVNSASIPATTSHDNILPTSGSHNERYENDHEDQMALDTNEVSTCPHSGAECAIGME